MQRKDLALRVLSTAAIMSIVTSIAAPAFADVYYIGNGSIDVKTMTGANGEYVQVTQNGKTYTDTSKEIVIKDGTSEANATLKEAARAEGTQAKPAVAPAAGAATQELEATGSADAAGESPSDPGAGSTLNETKEGSAQNQEGEDTTKKEEDPPKEPSTDNPTEDTPKDPSTEPAPPPLPPLRQRPRRPLWPPPLRLIPLRPLRQRAAAPQTPAKTSSGSSITGPKGC